MLFSKGVFFYAEYNLRLFFYLLFRKINILVANDLDTLLANYCVSKIRKINLVYDSHEYFTGVPELVNRKFVRSFWEKIEKSILPVIRYSYTVSELVAVEYKNRYGIKMSVVRNFPLYKQELIPSDVSLSTNDKRIVLYQGALNAGRGIEKVIEAMRYVDNAVFIIIGDGDIREELRDLTIRKKLESKVKFLGKIPFSELAGYTIKADIGISLEEKIGLSYYYSLPNKLFDYIRANVPVLASPFPEVERIIKKYELGILLDSNDPVRIAESIKEMLNNESKRKIWKKNLNDVSKIFCWEKEEEILLNVYKRAGL